MFLSSRIGDILLLEYFQPLGTETKERETGGLQRCCFPRYLLLLQAESSALEVRGLFLFQKRHLFAG